MRRTLRSLAALAMLAVIVAGCSNAPAGTGSSNSTAATHEKTGGDRPVVLDLRLAA
jgi:PBP1b-binding outer membrane lipoprotein LpoB